MLAILVDMKVDMKWHLVCGFGLHFPDDLIMLNILLCAC